MPKSAPIALALALSIALSGSVFAQDQLKGDNAPGGLSAHERARGSNAKLDNALLRIRQQQATPPATSSSARVAVQARSAATSPLATISTVT